MGVADDDNMFNTDNLLQVGARMYGFLEKGTSGVWPRIRALPWSIWTKCNIWMADVAQPLAMFWQQQR